MRGGGEWEEEGGSGRRREEGGGAGAGVRTGGDGKGVRGGGGQKGEERGSCRGNQCTNPQNPTNYNQPNQQTKLFNQANTPLNRPNPNLQTRQPKQSKINQPIVQARLPPPPTPFTLCLIVVCRSTASITVPPMMHITCFRTKFRRFWESTRRPILPS